MIYEIDVTFKRKNRKDKVISVGIDMDYKDSNFKECEDTIRHTLVDIANRFIDSEFYN